MRNLGRSQILLAGVVAGLLVGGGIAWTATSHVAPEVGDTYYACVSATGRVRTGSMRLNVQPSTCPHQGDTVHSWAAVAGETLSVFEGQLCRVGEPAPEFAAANFYPMMSVYRAVEPTPHLQINFVVGDVQVRPNVTYDNGQYRWASQVSIFPNDEPAAIGQRIVQGGYAIQPDGFVHLVGGATLQPQAGSEGLGTWRIDIELLAEAGDAVVGSLSFTGTYDARYFEPMRSDPESRDIPLTPDEGCVLRQAEPVLSIAN